MGSSGSGSEKLKYIELSRLSILPLAVSSDTITLSHSLGFARPLPLDSHTCPNIPGFDLGGSYTRDLGEKNPDSTYRYPLDDLPSGGACNPGQTIRISPGEMVLGILNINQGGTYSVNIKWYNNDTGAILYDYSHTASGGSYSYVWSIIGHFSWEIVSAGNYSCVFTVSGYGSATIDFTVADSRPPPVVAARPFITSATAYPSVGNETIMFLYSNDGTEGVVKWTGCTYGIYNGQETCWYDPNNSVKVQCIQPTSYLYRKGSIPGAPFLDGTESCIYGSRCVLGNDCVNNTCAGYEDWITVQYRFPIVAANVISPAIVTNLKVSPGNQYFDISWTPADDPLGGGKKVFAYYIQVWKAGAIDPTLTGYWYGDSVGVSIGGLENGVSYEIRVQSVSHNDIASASYASVTGTPGVTSVIATTGKYHDLVSYGSFAPWTIVEASTFNYGAYPMGDMIDPQWCATAPNESVSDSKSAIAACLVNLTDVYSSGRVTFYWYKGNTLIATYYTDIPSPLDYGKSKLDFWSVASWLCKVPGGIDYPGDYAVDVWAEPYNFHQYKPITVTCGNPVANFKASEPATLNIISIIPTAVNLAQSTTQQFTSSCKDTDGMIIACPTLSWNSSNTSVGTIDSNGLFTAISLGTTNVTASASGKTSNSAVVNVIQSLGTISITPISVNLERTQTQQFTVSCKDTIGNTMTCPSLSWNSSNTSVGTIDSNGLFTAISLGTTNVTASAFGKTSNAAIVNVEAINIAIGKTPTKFGVWTYSPGGLQYITDGNRSTKSGMAGSNITSDDTTYIQIDLGNVYKLFNEYIKFEISATYSGINCYLNLKVSEDGFLWRTIYNYIFNTGLSTIVEAPLNDIGNVRYIRSSIFVETSVYPQIVYVNWYEIETYI